MRLSVALSVLGTVCVPGLAGAQESAVELFEAAARAYEEERWADAADLLGRAYELEPDPVLLFNLGRAREQAGQREAAVAAYRSFVLQLPDAPEAARARERIAALTAPEIPRAAEPEPRAAEVIPPPPAASETGSSSLAPWLLVGAGAAVAIVGAIFAALAWSAYQDGRDSDIHERRVELQGSADDRALVANLSFGIAGALGLGGGLWLALD